MTYNLTEKQRAFAKWIIPTISEETLLVVFPDNSLSSIRLRGRIVSPSGNEYKYDDFDEGAVEALAWENGRFRVRKADVAKWQTQRT